jgi:hypothetical protein
MKDHVEQHVVVSKAGGSTDREPAQHSRLSQRIPREEIRDENRTPIILTCRARQ